MRNIDKAIHEDEWIQSLDDQHACAWFFLLISGCDDQGRFEVTPGKLRPRMFRSTATPNEEIEKVINNFAAAKKVFLYEVGGKKYGQVVNWWKYQNKSTFMAESKFPAPKGWTDCWNSGTGYHQSTSDNWEYREEDGGFQKSNAQH